MSNEKPFGLTARQKIQKGMTITREKIIPMEFDESRYDIVEVNVEIKDLDPVFHDYKIVNLSDLHLGQWLTAEYLETNHQDCRAIHYAVKCARQEAQQPKGRRP